VPLQFHILHIGSQQQCQQQSQQQQLQSRLSQFPGVQQIQSIARQAEALPEPPPVHQVLSGHLGGGRAGTGALQIRSSRWHSQLYTQDLGQRRVEYYGEHRIQHQHHCILSRPFIQCSGPLLRTGKEVIDVRSRSGRTRSRSNRSRKTLPGGSVDLTITETWRLAQ